ncbi:hypothetical protein [Mucilaginibacter kameinonensis]|uniref:hypothetical protein n=1 Tax=Mucilaginibacter kameinonensis TaxID=452286 RepID=UPI000EF7ED8E|nr:hypothetical protein [Mucilaginibacter kameinonensis]
MELTVKDTEQNMDYWLQRPYLSEATRSIMQAQEVLIVPEEDLREYTTPLFPSNLMVLYDELKQYFKVEAAINDEDYHELSLNSKVHKYGKFVVIAVIVPTFVTVLGNYISDKLKHEDPKDEIQLDITVQGDQGQAKTVHFKGTADNFNKVAEKVKQIAREQEDEHRTDTAHAATTKK